MLHNIKSTHMARVKKRTRGDERKKIWKKSSWINRLVIPSFSSLSSLPLTSTAGVKILLPLVWEHEHKKISSLKSFYTSCCCDHEKNLQHKKYVYGFCIECCCCLWKCKVFFINIAHVKCHSKCNFSFYIFLNWKVKFNRKREKMFNFQFSIKNKILFLHTEKVTTLIFWEIYSWKKQY